MSNGRYSASVDQLSQHLLRSAARRRDQPSTRSPALRYWNLAQQRHCRRSAPCRRAMPVSGDCAACHGPHTRGKRPGFRPRQANSRERRTVCWSGMDSNAQFRARLATVRGFVRVGADLPAHGHPSSCRPRRTDRVVGRGPGRRHSRPAKKMRYFSAPSGLAQGFSPIGRHASEAARY